MYYVFMKCLMDTMGMKRQIAECVQEERPGKGKDCVRKKKSWGLQSEKAEDKRRNKEKQEIKKSRGKEMSGEGEEGEEMCRKKKRWPLSYSRCWVQLRNFAG